MIKARRPGFEERVFSMARNLAEYGNYGKNPSKAAKILHGHHPEKSLRECRKVFEDFLAAYNDAIIFVDERRDFYIRTRTEKHPERPAVFSGDEVTFLEGHPAVPGIWALAMIDWILHWHYER